MGAPHGISKLIGLLATGCLVACGGGGGGGDAGNGGNTEPTLAIAAASVEEGDSGQTQVEFEVTLTPAATTEVTVDFATADDTADSTDFVSASGQLTFAAGTTNATIAVDIIGDTSIEADEAFRVVLSNAVNAAIGAAEVAGTIVNDDFPQLSIADATAAEGDSGVTTMTFAVTLDVVAIGDVTVDYVSSDVVAAAGDDYTAVNSTLVIPEGDTSAAIAVDIVTDTLIEPDEQFVVNLLNASANVEVLDDEGIGLITNDDLSRLRIEGGSATETNSGTSVLSIALVLSDATNADVAVDIMTTDRTAVAGQDYVALTETIVIAAGNTTADIAIEIIGDTIAENSEAFEVAIVGVNGPAVVDRALSRPVILDNDGPPSDPQVFGFGASAPEGDTGPVTMTFELFLDVAQSADVSVDYATTAGTAASPDDYVDTSGTVVFPAGTTEAIVDVTINGDTVAESDETFTLELSNPSAGIALPITTLVGTILDDEPAAVTPRLRAVSASVVEGDAGTTDLVFPVRLDVPGATVITADYATEPASATEDIDYTATSGTITFAIGETEQSIAVPVIGDTFTEDDETFRLRLSNVTGDVIVNGPVATGTIVTDEPISRVSIGNASLPEGDSGTSDMTFTVTLDVATVLPVTFDYQTNDDTAVAGSDYSSASGTVQIAPGDTTATIAVEIVGDTENENDERFGIALSNFSLNAAVLDDAAVGIITNDDGTPGWQTSQILDVGRAFSVTMDSQGRGAATYLTKDDPVTLDDTVTVARFESGAFLPPEDVFVIGNAIGGPASTMLDNGRILTFYRAINMQTSLYTPGQGWVDEEVSASFGFNQRLASNDTGDAVLVWESSGNNQNPSDILRNRYSQATGAFSGEELVENDEVDRAFSAEVDLDDAGNVIIVFSRPMTGNNYSYYDAAMGQWTTAAQISGLQFGINRATRMMGDGRAIVAARVRGFGNDEDSIEAWIYEPSTDTWSESGPVETSATEEAVLPNVVVDADGNIFIAWLQRPRGGFSSAWVNRYDAATDSWGTAQLLEGAEGTVSTGIGLAVDAAGNAIALWTQDLGTNGDRRFRIRTARYVAADDEWTPPEQLDDETAVGGAVGAGIAMDAAGNAIAIWQYPDSDEIATARFIAP